jgi:HlyD family secretion protein
MSTNKPDASDARTADHNASSPANQQPAADEKQPIEAADKRPPSKDNSSQRAREPNTGSPSNSQNRRRWPIAVGLIVLAVGVYTWYRLAHSAEVKSRLVLEGNIDVRQVNLAFKVDGRIVEMAVDEGDSVEAGQVVAMLDKRYFEDDLRVARARRDSSAATLARLEHGSRPEEIAEARANAAQQRAVLARSQQDFDRAANLVGKGAVSQEDFDRAKAALDEAKATLKYSDEALHMAEIGPRQEDIDAARAQLAGEDAAVIQSERRLADAELIAPSAGVILTRAREKGAIVAAAEPVFTLTLSTPVWVRTYVNERDLGRIQPGMAGEVHTDSAPDKIYHGRIGFISPTAEFTPKTVQTRELRTDLVYRLRVLVDNPDGGLRQGMPVTVSVELKKPSTAPGN